MHTYPGACNTKDVCTCLYNNSPCTCSDARNAKTQVSMAHQPIYTLHLYMVPMAHQPICVITKGFGSGPLQSPPPYLCIILSASYTHVHTKFSKIFKNMRILYSHSILALPSCILRTVPGPLDLYQHHGLIMELLEFPIQYSNRSHLKYAFWIHLNRIPINNMINIT
jgi:hypothetical protein